jgi:coenzyme PQQ synthesis protein D (PqqD)
MTAALDQTVRVPDDVLFRELQGEAVILNLASSTYFGLDAVGTRIWQLCEAHGALQKVFDAMQREFDAPGETLQSDLLTFVDELLARGLLALQ